MLILIQEKAINNNRDFQQIAKGSQSRIKARIAASERRQEKRARVHRGIKRLAPDSSQCNHKLINSISKSKAKQPIANRLRSLKVCNFKHKV